MVRFIIPAFGLLCLTHGQVFAAALTPPPARTLEIDEYTVEGNDVLPEEEIDDAVYPYLGPGQTLRSVYGARAALQKLYSSEGYQAVEVIIPPQHVRDGIVMLQVIEGRIGRLNVNGSRYFSLHQIKSHAPSLRPGTVPNFKKITRDIVALNTWQDRQVLPVLKAGIAPGTVDVDLNVKDTLPLHANLELNNFYSPQTTPLRVNGALTYDNLWQRGDTVSFNFQLAPERLSDAEIFEAAYIARIPNADWATVLLYGLISNSNVSSVGGSDVVGKGHVIGLRGQFTLPGGDGFTDSLSIEPDYKHFDQNLTLGGATNPTPITYFPITATYTANWQGADGSFTQLDVGPTIGFRGVGSNLLEYDAKRYDAQGNFIYLKGDLSRTQMLPAGFQLFGKAQWQIANEPLVNSEQFAGGGEESVRGYLESEVLGDSAMLGSVEVTTPSLTSLISDPAITSKLNDWRAFAWAEGGQFIVLDALPETASYYNLGSIGAGTSVQLVDHLNGMVEFALPLVTAVQTKSFHPRVDFRVWVAF